MTQQYQIALDPQLGLTPETFVAAWNEREAALAAGPSSSGLARRGDDRGGPATGPRRTRSSGAGRPASTTSAAPP
jgi:hypothetical protein